MKEKKVLIIGVVITVILLFTVGITYAAFNYNRTGTNNSQLVVGDIYMHYEETSPAITLNNMLPMNVYVLNTNINEDIILECNEYLYNTYGESWNGLEYYDPTPTPTANQKSLIAKFIAQPYTPTYYDYCSNNSWIRDEDNNILNDISNGVLSKTDISNLVTIGILTDNVKDLDYFEFTIDGKNTHLENMVLYNIQLAKGDAENSKVRIADKFLKFRLVEVLGETENILIDNKSYETINNTVIYSGNIPKQTNEEIVHTYRLYMWIDGNIKVGNTSDADYTIDEWNNLYASIKVNVNGEYLAGELLAEKLISKVGTEGLVAVNTAGNLDDGSGTIREYRYSGIGNYCTYTDGSNDYNLSVEGTTCPTTACAMTMGSGTAIANGNSDVFKLDASCAEMGGTELSLKTNEVHDSGLRNYILFNDELWRIVGIFNGEVKIVKDTPLTNDIYNQTTYTSTETSLEYNLKYEVPGAKYGYYIYKQLTDNSSNNDWTTSGVKAYLNEESGYYGTIKEGSRNLISETTYYLGNVATGENSDGWFSIQGTASEVYNQEKSSDIWYGNQVSWTGKIGLLYPSDYGYASNTNNWNSDMSYYHSNGGSLNNWLFNTEANFSWFLSPSSGDSDRVLDWRVIGGVFDSRADVRGSLRPTLNLKSTAIVTSGDGSYNNPYVLKES